MAEADLRNMIMNFRVTDLQVLLGFAGRNKTGKKQELQSRALDLVRLRSPPVEMKIRELHKRRYNHHIVTRTNNYELQEQALSERVLPQMTAPMNNNYPMRCNAAVRPNPMNHLPGPSYPVDPSKHYMHSGYTTHPNIKFKELPFYDVLDVLMKPTGLVPEVSERFQESRYVFHLKPSQAHDVAVSRDIRGNYECQIQMRFSLLETSCEQEDNFPPSICVKVNDKICPLPNPVPTNRPGVEPKRPSKPVNLTSLCKLSPISPNVVTVSWSSTYGRAYAFAIFLVRKLSSAVLLLRLKNNGVRNADFTTAMIKEKLQQGQDSEIATTSLRGSLICPLGKIKMELPCRAVTCTHVQCFDGNLYIQMNEKKPKWICPVCDKPALFKTLVIDGLFMQITSKVPAECTEVQFNEDGSWTPLMPMKKSDENRNDMVDHIPKNNSSKKKVEFIDVSSDSEFDDEWHSFNDNSTLMSSKPGKSGDSSPGTLSPPLMFLPPDTTITATAAPNPSYPVSTSQDVLPLPESLYTSNEYSDGLQAESMLPDLMASLPDPLPLTSTSSATSMYSHGPYSIPENMSSYIQDQLNLKFGSFQDQINFLNGSSGSQNSAYNSIDLFSFLPASESDNQREKNFEPKETNIVPDVISLD